MMAPIKETRSVYAIAKSVYANELGWLQNGIKAVMSRQPCLRLKPAWTQGLWVYIYIKNTLLFIYIFLSLHPRKRGVYRHPLFLSPLFNLYQKNNTTELEQRNEK